ncbi:hypothetical protein [Pseudogulbenkiania sp. MAI-1]|nr:hypothetical protein [Pseudogulbenkiania sp. MAI-1]
MNALSVPPAGLPGFFLPLAGGGSICLLSSAFGRISADHHRQVSF